jgi:membrane protease YdiL (CAAX protease family)
MMNLPALLMDFGPPAVSILILHYKLAPYPKAFPNSINQKREVIETLVLWTFMVSVVTAFMFSLTISQLQNPTPALVAQRIILGVFPELIVPLVYVRYVKKWTWDDLGFTTPKAPRVTAYALVYLAIGGLIPFLSNRAPLSVSELVLSLYQPAFIEEFFFRSILQGKLERALGQNKGWFYGGILFGLAHAPMDFFGPYWFGVEGNVLAAFLLLIKQIMYGWVYGIIFMKTRSIVPTFIGHYFVDWRLGSIIKRLL